VVAQQFSVGHNNHHLAIAQVLQQSTCASVGDD
jgi:hypothetical protein